MAEFENTFASKFETNNLYLINYIVIQDIYIILQKEAIDAFNVITLQKGDKFNKKSEKVRKNFQSKNQINGVKAVKTIDGTIKPLYNVHQHAL